ncbi:MAG: ABC transporter permease [Bacteroidales bacterium]|nr:ABC transporter permease [Bacteroidales bacterium]
MPLRFALRYLFARKSFKIINLISAIGATGMALGTAALIIVLSVFNGFNKLVADSLADAGAPLVIRPVEGKVFIPEGPAFDWMRSSDRIERMNGVLEEQAFLSYEGRQSLARVRGLDAAGASASPLRQHIIDGKWQLQRGDIPQTVAGASLAANLNIKPGFATPLEIHYPSRTQPVSLANPAATLRSKKVQLSGIVSVNASLDASLLVVPVEVLRDLLEYPREVSAVEIWPTGETSAFKKELQERLGSTFRVLDRQEQDQSIYRMMRYEKLAIYLILVFIVLIVAFNIYSSLRMLIIEKEADTATLRSLGAPESMLRRIFLTEGWMVSLLGMLVGLALGVVVVLLQQRFGLISLPGNFTVSSYPVSLQARDLLWTVAGVAGIGFIMALVPSRKI